MNSVTCREQSTLEAMVKWWTQVVDPSIEVTGLCVKFDYSISQMMWEDMCSHAFLSEGVMILKGDLQFQGNVFYTEPEQIPRYHL